MADQIKHLFPRRIRENSNTIQFPKEAILLAFINKYNPHPKGKYTENNLFAYEDILYILMIALQNEVKLNNRLAFGKKRLRKWPEELKEFADRSKFKFSIVNIEKLLMKGLQICYKYD
jgi:hypothetical protein